MLVSCNIARDWDNGNLAIWNRVQNKMKCNEFHSSIASCVIRVTFLKENHSPRTEL